MLAALNTDLDDAKSAPASASATTEKKGWKKVFSGSSKKPKGDKSESPVLLKSPDLEKPKKKKKSSEKGHKKQTSKDNTQNGAEEVTPDSSGFMGVGKDGVWISRKNFLRT